MYRLDNLGKLGRLEGWKAGGSVNIHARLSDGQSTLPILHFSYDTAGLLRRYFFVLYYWFYQKPKN
jgi:hypothetical protein